jgi:L-threonylcarbamoyladenylate synthase
MKIIEVDLNKDYTEAIREAIECLKYGGAIVYPTDTLYALGVNALNDIAVRKVYKIKQRNLSKPLPIVVKNMIWAKELAHINSVNEDRLNKLWPKTKLTAVLPRKPIVPSDITSGEGSVGIRVSESVFVDKLLGKYGYPLTSTSANISGQEPSNDINIIIEMFKDQIMRPDLVIDAGILPKSDPSTVIDLTGPKPKILRIGPSKPEQFLKILNI